MDLKSPFLDHISKFGIGFEPLFKQLESVNEAVTKAAQKSIGYPPFNIAKVSDNKYVIEIAVAGFGKQDIEIEIDGNLLKVSGKTQSETTEDANQYLHQGIANRQFSRQFSMADTVEIKNAELVNGMLKIMLENIISDSKKPRKVDIR